MHHRWGQAGSHPPESCSVPELTAQQRPLPRQLQLNCPHLTFSSGAELSHCEQSGNQSLFTNQLSSAPRQRGRRLGIMKGLESIFQGCWLLLFPERSYEMYLFPELQRESNYGFCRSSQGRGCVVIPGNVILILSHKSACQEPKQPEHLGAAPQGCPHRTHQLPRAQGDSTTSRPATLPNGFYFCSLFIYWVS